MMSADAENAAFRELRRAINSLADQLCRTVDGRFDVAAVVDTPDEAMQKLTMLVNFVIGSARRNLSDAQEREATLRAVLESAAEGIIMADSRGTVKTYNQAATKMFGYDSHDVVGNHVTMLMPEPLREKHAEHLARLLAGLATAVVPPREVTGRHRDGRIFPLRLAVSQVETSRGRVFTAIMTDLSDEKRMQVELTQAQKLESVGQLAAGIAHEINTPTQYIGDNARFLKDAFAELEKALAGCEELVAAARDGGVTRELAEGVAAKWQDADVDYLRREIPAAIDQSLDGILRVADIVRAMKEFSHPGTDEMILVNLNEAIETTITVSRNEWKYVAELRTDLADDLPEVPGLPGPLNQVILNLIVNAAHAIQATIPPGSSEKGVILVSSRSCGDGVEVRVADTGCGIPHHVQHRIFDPFFTTKEVGKGTGQGLAISRSVVVDKHGGTIHFETQVGAGTTFIVRLPLTKRTSELAGAAT